MSYRLTVTPPGGEPLRMGRTLTLEVSAYRAMVVLMNADPAVKVPSPVDYLSAREFAQTLINTRAGAEVRHRPTGVAFRIETD